MPVDKLEMMMEMQLELQKEHMKDGNPQLLTGDDMATFMTWNFAACVKELSEAMDEVGWKPWGTGRSINEELFLREMVDAFHFFMNLLLCALPDSPSEIVNKFTKAYLVKNRVNAQRQVEGYDGMKEKCPICHRELIGKPAMCPEHGLPEEKHE